MTGRHTRLIVLSVIGLVGLGVWITIYEGATARRHSEQIAAHFVAREARKQAFLEGAEIAEWFCLQY